MTAPHVNREISPGVRVSLSYRLPGEVRRRPLGIVESVDVEAGTASVRWDGKSETWPLADLRHTFDVPGRPFTWSSPPMRPR